MVTAHSPGQPPRRDGGTTSASRDNAAAFDCEIEPRRETVVVRPIGELDIATVGQFHDALSESLAPGFPHLVLDLRELRFIDSSGLHAVIDLASSPMAAGRMDIIPGPATVHRAFALAGLVDRLPFAPAHEALAEAQRAKREGTRRRR